MRNSQDVALSPFTFVNDASGRSIRIRSNDKAFNGNYLLTIKCTLDLNDNTFDQIQTSLTITSASFNTAPSDLTVSRQVLTESYTLQGGQFTTNVLSSEYGALNIIVDPQPSGSFITFVPQNTQGSFQFVINPLLNSEVNSYQFTVKAKMPDTTYQTLIVQIQITPAAVTAPVNRPALFNNYILWNAVKQIDFDAFTTTAMPAHS